MVVKNWVINSLREVQQKVVEAYLGGQDVFVCLPTGSGKSFCFESTLCN